MVYPTQCQLLLRHIAHSSLHLLAWSAPREVAIDEQANTSLVRYHLLFLSSIECTWKALLNLKTLSYASFGGNRFRASCIVSFSSGIRSSAFNPAFVSIEFVS